MPAERSRYLGNQNSKHEELGISRFEKKTFKRKIGQFWTLPKSEENLKALGILTAHKPSSAKRKLACIAIASRFQRCALHLWDAPTDLDLDHAGLGPWPWCQTWLCAKAQRRCFMTRNGPDMQNQSIPSTYICPNIVAVIIMSTPARKARHWTPSCERRRKSFALFNQNEKTPWNLHSQQKL